MSCYCIHAAEGVDPSVFINQTTTEGVAPRTVEVTGNETIVDPSNFEPFCPIPEPFINNINSDFALLKSDGFNGTQPEDADVYICYVNGLPAVTVEIVVLGKFDW